MGKRLEITEELRKKYSNIDFDDFKYKNNSNAKLYRGNCPKCSKDRGYISARSRWGSLCRSCNGIKSGSKNMKGKEPHNKGKQATLEQRIKQSCSHRKIKIKDFDEFKHTTKQRHSYNNSNIRQECYENADFTCDLYGVKGEELNAHHLDSWHNNEDKRFELSNLVCLSKAAHKTFHKIYGNKNNTKEQYEQFKSEVDKYRQTKQDLFLVAGCPASGKSWVCKQIKDNCNYVSYDGVNKNYHIYELLKGNNKPLLYDPTIKVSTFTKRYGHLFNIRLVVINEDEKTINERMVNRGGVITETIKKRISKMNNLSKKCEFSGTSSEVLEYIKKALHA